MPVAPLREDDCKQQLRVTRRVSPSDADLAIPLVGPMPPQATTPPQDGVRTSSPDDPKQGVTRTHLATRLLRKSASADSCIAQRSSTQSRTVADTTQDALPSVDEPSSPQPDRTDTHALSSPPSVMSLSGYLRSKVGRRRGTANATMTDTDVSTQEDSDFDRSNITPGTVKGRMRARLLSLKSSKTPVPASQMSDVPRLPARGASTSLSNLKTPDPANSKLPRKSATSLALEQPPFSPTATTRARSHSVGPPSRTNPSRTAKRFSFGNQVPRPETLQELSIAVVGATDCGKSTFIRKGFRRHDLSAPEVLTGTIAAEGKTRNVAYTRRTAHFLTGFNTDTVLSVYEYDLKNWSIDNDALPVWPAGLPRVDGVFVCYDESDRASFADIIRLVSGLNSSRIPSLVIACKADLEKRVHPGEAALAIKPYSKLTEVSCNSDDGKKRMRKAVDWLVKRIVASHSPAQISNFCDSDQQSVSYIDLPSQKSVRTKKNLTLSVQTQVPKSSICLTSPITPPVSTARRPPLPRNKSSSLPSSSAKRSPTKVCSMNDIRSGQQTLVVSSSYESEKETMRKSATSSFSFATKSTDSFVDIFPSTGPTPKRIIESVAIAGVSGDLSLSDKGKHIARVPPTPWATLDELLERVFFLAISGDDPSFIAHFFLSYRRFATPRSVLLGMQKRLNELRKPTSDIVLACFAQMRICNLLEQWMREYRADFAVPGTHGALLAVVRHVLEYSHTLSYGSEFLPFIDALGTLNDEDAEWALKPDVGSISDNDTEADSTFDVELDSSGFSEPEPLQPSAREPSRTGSELTQSPRTSNRERRSSLPLGAMARFKAPIVNALLSMDEQNGPSPREVVSRLQRTAAALNNYESESIANEITGRELDLFLKIKPRDWLRHTLVPGKKNPKTDPIARFNAHYNDLHEWAVSLILCHDKPKMRARQIEKFAEVATKLRMLNNYSGLRALITAINQATYPGDQPMEIFKTKIDLHKKYLSSDILLRTTGAHQSYRMALRNTKGPCIPSLEVHTSDLRRAHEGNADTKPDDPTKINWAKYNMMGRFIETTTSIQRRCIGPNGYKLVENHYLGQLFEVPVMDYEMQQSRVAQPSDDDVFSPPSSSASFVGNHSKESSVIRRILQW